MSLRAVRGFCLDAEAQIVVGRTGNCDDRGAHRGLTPDHAESQKRHHHVADTADQHRLRIVPNVTQTSSSSLARVGRTLAADAHQREIDPDGMPRPERRTQS
jgi:hypothetical protein